MRFTSRRELLGRFKLSRASIAGLLLPAMVLPCSGCGNNNKASGAIFETLPDSPIVITADTKDYAGNTIKAPWFSFRTNATNGTGSVFTLLSLTMKITGIDSTGAVKTTAVGWSPSDFSVSLPMGLSSYSCVFLHFGIYQPNDSKPLALDGDDHYVQDPTSPSDPNAKLYCKRIPLFMVGNNPSGPGDNAFIYSIIAKPLGWFGDYNNPTDRFETSYTFKTQ